MCLSSHASRKQHASSISDSPLSMITLVAKELMSTHTVTSRPSMLQSPCAGSFCAIRALISDSIWIRGGSRVLSSQSAVTEFARRLTNAVAMQSHPHTGRCPINFPHREKMLWWVSTSGNIGSSPPQHHCNFPCFFMTHKPSTWVPSLNHSGSLHVNPNCRRWSLTRAAVYMLSLTNISSIYEDVTPWIVSSCAITIFIMDRIIIGATFSPNPKQVRQYLCPCLKGPQRLVNVDLKIGPAQIQHSDIRSFLSPLS